MDFYRFLDFILKPVKNILIRKIIENDLIIVDSSMLFPSILSFKCTIIESSYSILCRHSPVNAGRVWCGSGNDWQWSVADG